MGIYVVCTPKLNLSTVKTIWGMGCTVPSFSILEVNLGDYKGEMYNV